MWYPVIELQRGREQSVVRRHPWIFSGAIRRASKSLSDGDTIHIADADGDIIGTGHFQDSSLAVRVVTFEAAQLDLAFWKQRLTAAFQWRRECGFHLQAPTNAYRLVHGEGDGLPGLIIDVYAEVAVIQAHSIGMYLAKELIATSLLEMNHLGVQHIYGKSKESLPTHFAQTIEDSWIHGDHQDQISVREEGLEFIVDVVRGQKTGMFLDQRVNRQLVRHYAKDKHVLNCFSYSGGFSMNALQGGALSATSVDASALALEWAAENAVRNHFGEKHTTAKENVLPFLTRNETQYDLVIVDPPAFAKTLEKRHNAVQAYKRLNALAMSRVKPGGMLFTFSCSQVVDKPLFHHTIVAAAIEANRPMRIVHDLSQGPDHPVSVFHPEGHYLKGLVLRLDD